MRFAAAPGDSSTCLSFCASVCFSKLRLCRPPSPVDNKQTMNGYFRVLFIFYEEFAVLSTSSTWYTTLTTGKEFISKLKTRISCVLKSSYCESHCFQSGCPKTTVCVTCLQTKTLQQASRTVGSGWTFNLCPQVRLICFICTMSSERQTQQRLGGYKRSVNRNRVCLCDSFASFCVLVCVSVHVLVC